MRASRRGVVVSYQRTMDITVLLVMLIFSIHSYADIKSVKPHSVSAITLLRGSVIDAPCSITLQNRYQTIDFSSLALALLSNSLQREMHDQPFIIELQDCGSVYSTVDLKHGRYALLAKIHNILMLLYYKVLPKGWVFRY